MLIVKNALKWTFLKNIHSVMDRFSGARVRCFKDLDEGFRKISQISEHKSVNF